MRDGSTKRSENPETTIINSSIYLFDLFDINITKGLTWLLFCFLCFTLSTTKKPSLILEYICTKERLVNHDNQLA